jgi:Sec23/Sec24 beta-sandwich domain
MLKLLLTLHSRTRQVLPRPWCPLPYFAAQKSCLFMLNLRLTLHLRERQVLSASVVSIQAALLYTTSTGERRIRVHNVALPVKTIIQVRASPYDRTSTERVQVQTLLYTTKGGTALRARARRTVGAIT